MLKLPKSPEWELHHKQEKFAIIPISVYNEIVEILEKHYDQNKCCPSGRIDPPASSS